MRNGPFQASWLGIQWISEAAGLYILRAGGIQPAKQVERGIAMAVKVEKLVKKFAEKSTILSEKVYDSHFFDTQEKDMLLSVVEYDYRRQRIEKVLSADLSDEEVWHSFCLFLRDALDKKAIDKRADASNFRNIKRKELETIFHNVVSGITKLPIVACQYGLEYNEYRVSLRVGFAEIDIFDSSSAFSFDKRRESRIEEYPPEEETAEEGEKAEGKEKDSAEGK